MAVIKNLPATKSLKNQLEYLATEGKTRDDLRSGINCTPDNVELEFNIIKELYNKPIGKQYYHITQSFSPEDKIDDIKVHNLGIEWIEENIQDHQIYVVTHIDRDHLHNHFVINSVNMNNGLKLQISPKKLEEMKMSSNRICKREGLKEINLDLSIGLSKTDEEYRLEKRGITTWKYEFRQAIDKVKNVSEDLEEFKKKLEINYNIDILKTDKNIFYKNKEDGKVISGKKLGGSYSKAAVDMIFNSDLYKDNM